MLIVVLNSFWDYSFIYIMKKVITIFCIVASLIIILDSMNFADAFIMLVFAGIVPGTNFQLSPEQSFGLFAILICFIVIFFKSPKSHKNHIGKSDINYS